MLLFKPEHVAPILAGTKTQTRRIWSRCRVRVGAAHQCYTRPPMSGGKPFCRVRIEAVHRERLGDISLANAWREGYPNVDAYIDAFCRINRVCGAPVVLNQVVWVVDFQLETEATR